jgi:hypothetical protein
MLKKEFKFVEQEVLVDILCDSCGKSCKGERPLSRNFHRMNLSVKWGYGSKHDLEEWSAQICEACVLEKLEPIIKFNKESYPLA